MNAMHQFKTAGRFLDCVPGQRFTMKAAVASVVSDSDRNFLCSTVASFLRHRMARCKTEGDEGCIFVRCSVRSDGTHVWLSMNNLDCRRALAPWWYRVEVVRQAVDGD